MIGKVELHPAYFFDCDECGREVFIKGELVHKNAILENTPEEHIEAAAEYFSSFGDYLYVEPEIVQCSHEDCKAIFEVDFEYPK